jgi:hypothetical protein
VADEAERLTPEEARVRDLLGELGSDGAPHGEALTRSVVRTARWQRSVRRTLLTLGTAAGAIAAGAGSAFRAYRRR